MKEDSDLTTNEQIAFRENAEMTADGFANRLTALENKIGYLERSSATSRFVPKKTEGFTNDLNTLRHDFNQLLEALSDIEVEVDLQFTRFADHVGRMRVQMGIEL